MIRGTLYWAKILGAPRLNNFGKKQWSIEIEPDAKSLEIIKELKLMKRLKDPDEKNQHKNRFMAFHHDAVRADGLPADPVRVVDSANQSWSGGLIGNGSVGDIKFVVKDYGPGKQQGVYIRAVRVLDHVPYVAQEFEPLDSDDEFFAGDDDFARLPDGMEPVSGEPVEPQLEEDLNDDLP